MFKIILRFLLCCPVFAYAQSDSFTIIGKIGNYNAPAKVYLWYKANGKSVIDSALIKDGNFYFKGALIEGIPQYAHLLLEAKGLGINKAQDHQTFYLEPGNIKISGTEMIATASIRGTKTNNDNAEYQTKLKAAAINTGISYIGFLGKGREKFAIDQQFVTNNPESFISLLITETYAYVNADYNIVAKMFDRLSPLLIKTTAGLKLAHKVGFLKTIAIGAQAPLFTQHDIQGLPIQLKSFRGQYVLIDFWASWCIPCRQENPNVVKAYRKYHEKGFGIIGVSLDEPNSKSDWLSAINNDGLTWTQLSDLKSFKNEVALLYGVNAIPQNFLIDPQGKIVAKNLRGDDLDAKLEQLLGKI